MKRRQFITLLGGMAAAWPLAARAQQVERMRRIGVLMGVADDAEGQARIKGLQQGLRELGWIEGRNVHIDYRWTGGDATRVRAYAAELVKLSPDVIVAHTPPVIAARCGKRQAPFQSFLRQLSIPFPMASLIAWRVRAEILPAPPILNSHSLGKCWRCSRKWRPALSELPLYSGRTSNTLSTCIRLGQIHQRLRSS